MIRNTSNRLQPSDNVARPPWAVMPLYLAMALLASTQLASADDAVVARRGTDRITLNQARNIAASLDPEARSKLAGQQGWSTLLRNVLLQRALLQQAKTAKWDQRPEVAALAKRAADLAIAQSFLTSRATVPAAYPADADIQTAYTLNKSQLMQPRSYHLVQLFVPVTGVDQEHVRQKLATLGHKAKHVDSPLAKSADIQGLVFADLGWLAETQIVPDVKTVVSGLQEGAIADPVCTRDGCHLIQLIATRPAGPAPLAQVKDALARALRQRKQAEAEQAYANKLLADQPVELDKAQLSRLDTP